METKTVIRETYKEFKPTFDILGTVRRLLNGIPEEYIHSIGAVVLTDSASLPAKERKAYARAGGQRFQVGAAGARYHQQWNNNAAWIEIFADNILNGWPKHFLRLRIFRDLAISKTLFHEIGHHIHYTQTKERRDEERIARHWQRKLSRLYYRRRYWYLIPLFSPASLLIQIGRRFRKQHDEQAN